MSEARLWPGWRGAVGAAAFRLGWSARRFAYDLGVLRRRRVDGPVLSVGNLLAGGTGKTPFVRLLARRIGKRHRVAILSRGYARRDASKSLLVVSEGWGATVTPDEAGDEPYLLAESTPAAVVVCANRHRAAEVAFEELEADIVILDDGFQHWRIARDADIVMLDAADPYGDGKLLPQGLLREPPSALKRADLFVLSHLNEPGPVSADLGLIGTPRVQVLAEGRAPFPLKDRPVALLAGIARPERFVQTVRHLGADIRHVQTHPDHTWFSPEALSRFYADAKRVGAPLLLTTEKDAVRLSEEDRRRFDIVSMDFRILSGAAELDFLLAEVLGITFDG